MNWDHSVHGRSNEPMNPCASSGFIGLFDLPWSQRSRIPDPDPDHPKGTHPLIHAVSFDGDSNFSNSLIIHKESSKEINV